MENAPQRALRHVATAVRRHSEAVLDSGALLAYVHRADAVGELLFRAAEDGFEVVIPSTCLVEAYSALSADEFDMLRFLPMVSVDEPRSRVDGPDDLPTLGGMTASTSRIGATHAALAAAGHSAAVFTSLPAPDRDRPRQGLADFSWSEHFWWVRVSGHQLHNFCRREPRDLLRWPAAIGRCRRHGWRRRRLGRIGLARDRNQAKTFLGQLPVPSSEALIGLDAATVTGFVVEQANTAGSVESAKALVTALRSLLRFLHVDGRITGPLVGAVPAVAGWRLGSLPRGLQRGQVAAFQQPRAAVAPAGNVKPARITLIH